MLTRTGRALQTRTMRTEYDIVLFIIQYLVGACQSLDGNFTKKFLRGAPRGARRIPNGKPRGRALPAPAGLLHSAAFRSEKARNEII